MQKKVGICIQLGIHTACKIIIREKTKLLVKYVRMRKAQVFKYKIFIPLPFLKVLRSSFHMFAPYIIIALDSYNLV